MLAAVSAFAVHAVVFATAVDTEILRSANPAQFCVLFVWAAARTLAFHAEILTTAVDALCALWAMLLLWLLVWT